MPVQGQAKRRSAAQTTEKPVKRTRVSRACDQCRTAREKCDGSQPTCSTCSTQKRPCAYTANPKKRGIQPGYIRSLELALAWLFQQNAENETLLNNTLAQGGTASIFLSRESKESNKLHKRWRKARFYTEVDKLLSGGGPSRHDQSEPLSPQSEDDQDSDADEPSTAFIDHSAMVTDVLQTSSTRARPSQSQPDIPAQLLATVDTTISMPPDSWTMLETYFTYTQCWLPICEKYDILKLSYSYPAQGLTLSSTHIESGSHAELWSVLAVASLYDSGGTKTTLPIADRLYSIARSLIPGELGNFDSGHVKALLNLAIYNIALARTDAARLLVGCASRVLEAVDQLELEAIPRRKHVFAGCFLLDSFLSVQLNRRPYFQKGDIEAVGLIDEDGLEEWQPWTGNAPSSEQTRTPMLALSLFNSLLDLIDILVSGASPLPDRPSQHALEKLRSWEMSLPPKLNYIRSSLAPSHLTPPAALLQLTYHCTNFILKRSKPDLHRFLELFERCRQHNGIPKLPPIAQVLLEVLNRHTTYLPTDDRARLQILQNDVVGEWVKRDYGGRPQAGEPSATPWTLPITAMQMPTPESLQTLLPMTQSMDQPGTAHNAEAMDPFVSSTSSMTGLPLQPISRLDPRFPEVSSDLENFFDELASLDSGTKVDNQPQFMQNLGFAPDASMADLFSEYIPMQSTAFLSPEIPAPVNFDQYHFYEAG
jgi:hypothetical protein